MMNPANRRPSFSGGFWLAFLLLLLGSMQMSAQVVLSGVVSDSATGKPLPYCPFLVKGTLSGGVADDKGQFSINVAALPSTLVFTMTGYATKPVAVTEAGGAIMVKLKPKAVYLKPVVINGERATTWHPDDEWAFMDFKFYDDYILALVSIRGKNKEYLVLMDTLGSTVTTLPLHQHPDSLFTDCIGAVHLFSGDSVYQVYYDYRQLSLPYVTERNTFVQTMLPCRCQSGPYYYFSFSGYHGQKQDFYWINWYTRGKYQPFLSVHDSAKIIAYNEDYDIRYFLERRRCCQEYSEPVDSIVRNMDRYRELLPLSPEESTWLAPVDCPLALAGNSVYIANTLDTVLLTYRENGLLTDSVFFYCMRIPGWKSHELYSDPLNKTLYGRVTDKNGNSVFIRIDPLRGKEAARYEATGYNWMAKPQIRGGYLYFLWKDPYSIEPEKIRVIALQ